MSANFEPIRRSANSGYGEPRTKTDRTRTRSAKQSSQTRRMQRARKNQLQGR